MKAPIRSALRAVARSAWLAPQRQSQNAIYGGTHRRLPSGWMIVTGRTDAIAIVLDAVDFGYRVVVLPVELLSSGWFAHFSRDLSAHQPSDSGCGCQCFC